MSLTLTLVPEDIERLKNGEEVEFVIAGLELAGVNSTVTVESINDARKDVGAHHTKPVWLDYEYDVDGRVKNVEYEYNK